MKRIDTRYAYALGFAKAAEACGVDPEGLAKYAAAYESSPIDQTMDEMTDATNANNAAARLRPMARVETQRVQSAQPGETVVFDPRFMREYSSFSNRYGHSGSPLDLAKTAQAKALKTLARPFTRYWELLAGTGKATNGYRAIRGQLEGVLNMAARNNDADAVKKLLQLKSQLDIAAHNHTQALGRPFWRQVSKYGIKPKSKVYGEGLVKAKGGGYKFNKDVSGELDKVLAARLGTAGVGLGGGYLALAGGDEEV